MSWQDDIYADAMARRQSKAAKPKTASGQPRRKYHDYKADFLDHLRLLGLPLPSHGQGCEQKELQFARPRLWRFDWAYADRMIAIEYQGGNYTGKGHNTIKNLRNDYEKFTEAALRGWTLILIDSGSVRDGSAVAWVERALRERLKTSPRSIVRKRRAF